MDEEATPAGVERLSDEDWDELATAHAAAVEAEARLVEAHQRYACACAVHAHVQERIALRYALLSGSDQIREHGVIVRAVRDGR